MKILVIQTSFIGDVILATSVVEKLHRHYPDAEVFILLRKGNEALFKNHPFLKVIIWDKNQRKYHNLYKKLLQIRHQNFDLVINLHRHFATGWLSAFSSAKETIGFDKNPLSIFYTKKLPHHIDNGTHEVERNQSLIAHLTDNNYALPRLYPSPGDFEKVASYKHQPYAIIAPASVWETKQLPKEKWLELINKLNDVVVYIIGAPSDFGYGDYFIKNANHQKLVNLCGKLSLLQSAALIKDAQMTYVNDSAPLHLASAMNAPVTAFFCSTSPKFGFGPLSDVSIVIEATEPLSCKPCGIHGKKTCPEGHFKCGQLINIQNSLL